MRRDIIFLTLLVLPSAPPTAAASEPVADDSLLGWLRIIDSDTFTLLCASNQHGYYFAVKIDSDGDILFCKHKHREGSTNNARFVLTVEDKHNNDLHDIDSQKESPDSVRIAHHVNESSSVTIAYPAGVIYPLREHDHTTLRVRYTENRNDGRKVTLFDQFVYLPVQR